MVMVWILWLLGQNTDNLQTLARYSGLVKVSPLHLPTTHPRSFSTGQGIIIIIIIIIITITTTITINIITYSISSSITLISSTNSS